MKQGVVCLAVPLQSLPPFCGGGLSHVLVSTCTPSPPQLMEQAPLSQADQPPSIIPATDHELCNGEQIELSLYNSMIRLLTVYVVKCVYANNYQNYYNAAHE